MKDRERPTRVDKLIQAPKPLAKVLSFDEGRAKRLARIRAQKDNTIPLPPNDR